MSTAPLDRLPYGFLAKRFPGVDRDVEIFALNVVKGVDVFLWRISAFFARQIEAHNAVGTKIHGALCDLTRRLGRHAPHRTKNQSKLNAKVLTSAVEPAQNGGNDVLEMQSL